MLELVILEENQQKEERQNLLTMKKFRNMNQKKKMDLPSLDLTNLNLKMRLMNIKSKMNQVIKSQ